MSHQVTGSNHSRLHQHLLSGNKINVQGYSHTVCVKKESAQSWLAKDYEVIEEASDSVLLGKRKQAKQQTEKQ